MRRQSFAQQTGLGDINMRFLVLQQCKRLALSSVSYCCKNSGDADCRRAVLISAARYRLLQRFFSRGLLLLDGAAVTAGTGSQPLRLPDATGCQRRRNDCRGVTWLVLGVASCSTAKRVRKKKSGIRTTAESPSSFTCIFNLWDGVVPARIPRVATNYPLDGQPKYL